ncbi:MAG: DUF2914 domain-containing protein, partial [Flavobacteriales bacterium]|nr:DUF2914 domain-containing protein [Flavobacteriales bacterium]
TVFTTSSSTVTVANEDSLVSAGIKLEAPYFASREEAESAVYKPEEYFVTKGLKEGLENVFENDDSTTASVTETGSETAKEEAKAGEDEVAKLAAEAEAKLLADEAASEAKKMAAAAAEIALAEEEARKEAETTAEAVTMEELDKEISETLVESSETKTETTHPVVTESTLIDKKYVLSNVYFDFDSSVLNMDSRKALDALWATLDKASNVKVEISGHTDDKGEAAYNQFLSLARANTVVSYLIEKGISKERLIAKGYGATSPIKPNSNEDGSDNPEGRKSNRRTELKVLDVVGTIAGSTPGSNTGGAALAVIEGIVCTGVGDLKPIGGATSFSSTIERLYYFSNITAQAGVTGSITHIWYYKSEKMAEVSLDYEGGPRWRTFSSKRIVPSWKGKWKVDVVSDSGTIIKSTEFTVE